LGKWIKNTAVLLLLAIILAPLLFAGCGEKEAGQESSDGLDLPGILGDSILAMKNVNSYTYVMEMKMALEATGGSSPGRVSTSMQSSGAADIAAKKLKTAFQMHLDEITLEEQPEDMPRDFSAEMYMIEDTLYMKMDLEDLGEQWVKTPLTEELKEAYNLDMVEQQVTPLETATDIKFVRYETVDGSECYVLKMVPDIASMKDWLQGQQMTQGAFDFNEITNLQDIFKELAYTVWITKDGKLMKKMDVSMLTELSPAQVGVEDTEFDKMTMKIDLEMTIKDFNQSVSIILPVEDEDATEM